MQEIRMFFAIGPVRFHAHEHEEVEFKNEERGPIIDRAVSLSRQLLAEASDAW